MRVHELTYIYRITATSYPISGRTKVVRPVTTYNQLVDISAGRGCLPPNLVSPVQVVRLMNTYRLESKKPFNVECVTALLQEVLTRDLATAHYEPNSMTKTCVSLAGEIRNRVKQLNYDR